MTTTEINISKYIEQTQSNGKFENEKPLTPYLWERSLDGDHGEILTDGEHDHHHAERIELYCHEWEAFNQGNQDFPMTWILVENDQGFVMTMEEDQYQSYISL